MSSLHGIIGSEPVSVGPDLRLRQFRLTDAGELVKLHQDPALMRWLLDDISLDDQPVASDFILGLTRLYRSRPGLGIWALERREVRYSRAQLVAQGALKFLNEDELERMLQPRWYLQGWFNLTPVPNEPQRIELGSRLQRAAWGRSIACGVGSTLVDYAFEVLRLPRLYLHCHPQNTSALYCAAWLGFDEPEAVDFLGSDAIRLSLRPSHFAARCTVNDSTRRRDSRQYVEQWTSVAAGALS